MRMQIKRIFVLLFIVFGLFFVLSAEEKSKVKYLNTEEFKTLVYDYKASPNMFVFNGDKPVIVDFYADWCGPCKRLGPILDELSVEYGDKIQIYKVNTDKNQDLARFFKVSSIPYLFFIPMGGEQPAGQAGLVPKADLKKLIDEFLLKNNN